jgi:hypothetical protein
MEREENTKASAKDLLKIISDILRINKLIKILKNFKKRYLEESEN